jgi:hypothetical protein
MSARRVNSVAHNFGHHFLWFRKGFIFEHIARKACEADIATVTVDILLEQITAPTLDTAVFRHVISELRTKFYDCLDSVRVQHDYITEAKVSVDATEYPIRRCRCTIRGCYGHTYSREVKMAPGAVRTPPV